MATKSTQDVANELLRQAAALTAQATQMTRETGGVPHRQFAVSHVHTSRVKHAITGDELVVNTDDLDPEIHLAIDDPDAQARNLIAPAPPNIAKLKRADEVPADDTGGEAPGEGNAEGAETPADPKPAVARRPRVKA